MAYADIISAGCKEAGPAKAGPALFFSGAEEKIIFKRAVFMLP
jgi:hypothetical protein